MGNPREIKNEEFKNEGTVATASIVANENLVNKFQSVLGSVTKTVNVQELKQRAKELFVKPVAF